NVVARYNTDGIPALGDIALTADGVLVASRATTVPFGSAGGDLAVYSWTNPQAAPAIVFTTETLSRDVTDFIGGVKDATVGNTFAVSGRLNDIKIFTPAVSADGVRILGFYVRPTGLQQTSYSAKIPATAGDVTLTVTPASRDNLLLNSTSMMPVEYFFDWTAPGKELTLVGSFPEGATTLIADGVSYTRLSSRPYALVPTCNQNGAAYTARLYNVNQGIKDAVAVSPLIHKGIGNVKADYATTGISKIDGVPYLHLFVAGQGLASYTLFSAEESETPQDVDFAFATEWVNANTTDNAPEHIDGTNAQQGTAVNGLFYINDSEDKKIYVFDKSGCIGSLPGGSGRGTTRDDKGNIIVRDDQQTGTEHSFIIYPAGATPENPGTPVTFTTTVKLAGQTDFISAGGDVLGSGGHIYLFPEKQSGVNIIAVENGQPTGCDAVQGLKISGSIAGYVFPINDNTENWLYQVRGNGIYMYNGGTNTDISTERYSTKAPARNSTGGCAVFKLRGHQILVHNSGANYKGGFTLKNMTKDNEVIATVEPTGKLGNGAGGNVSGFNWLIPEKVDGGTYRIYQYCPSNGMGVYTLRDLNWTGVDDITVGGAAAESAAIVLQADHNTLTVYGVENVTDVKVYSVAGVLVAYGVSDTVNISALAPGMYIATVNNTASAKFMKK
ncbi:MAG: T9SS type A sorting domain-containing protein, partial [Muribaculaceae bacterium]|nr:T9SS type A sorting domain-containing protein [Muribaculaceae bacterium]